MMSKIPEMSEENSFYAPRFLSSAPPLSNFEDELVWMNIANSVAVKPIYMTDEFLIYTNEDIQRLCIEAFKQALSINDNKIVMNELEKDSNFVHKMKITPENISSLIEFNPLIAKAALVILLDTEKAADYLNSMVNMEMSINSLEAVNQLTTSIELPTEFLQLYICNCIAACEKMTDKFKIIRSVRVLCVFIISLIRKKKINLNEFGIEIESFCMTFSKIKEATDLYKLCKAL